MKPIWYFVGILLFVMGVIVEAAGVYMWIVPQEKTTVLSEIHPNIWWGLIMMAAGLVYFIRNKNKVV